MAVDEEFKDAVMDLLLPLGDVTEKKMFGGYGIFESGAMFALMSGRAVYFKVDDSNRAQYEEMGSGKYGSMPYYRVPDEVLEDEPKLHRLVEESVALAHAGKKKK
jgi:DNA transformation protein and related proteins